MFEYGKKSLNHIPSSNRSMSLTSTPWVARCRGRSALTPNLFGHRRHAKVTLGWCRWLCFNIPIWNKENVSNILQDNLWKEISSIEVETGRMDWLDTNLKFVCSIFIGSVRPPVCLCVCHMIMFVCALLADLFVLWPWFLAWGSTLTGIAWDGKSRSKVKGQGQTLKIMFRHPWLLPFTLLWGQGWDLFRTILIIETSTGRSQGQRSGSRSEVKVQGQIFCA